MVLRSARTLDRVLEQYARVEAARAGHTQADLGAVSTEQLLRGVRRTLEAREGTPAVLVETGHARLLLHSDPGLLERVLTDLASEAVRRIPSYARVHIAVELEPGAARASCHMHWDDGAENGLADPIDAHAVAVRAARAVLPLLGAELELAEDSPELVVRVPLAEPSRSNEPSDPGDTFLSTHAPADRPADAIVTVPSQAEPGGTP